MTLSFDRYCSEIVSQTSLLADCVRDADLTTPVPSCPGWDLSRLLHHLGDVHRWAETTVRTRATGPLPVEHSAGLAVPASQDPAVLVPWLTEGAGQLAATLRGTGPDAAMFTPFPSGTASFYARRFTHETAVHRADATLALGAPYALDQDVAADAVDEWLELGTQPRNFDVHPELRELLGPGRTLHFHATDTPPEADAEWVVDLTGDVATWRRAHEKSAVAVRGPLTDLLLIVYRRRPPAGDAIQVFGDQDLLAYWLDRVSFG
jgi:uncharacterized protein (TIGR03083 family)